MSHRQPEPDAAPEAAVAAQAARCCPCSTSALSKVVCLVARLDPVAESDLLRGRTHRARIIGIGHQRSRGLKGGAIVDLEGAEQAIRLAVDAAERMAKVEIRAAIVNMTGGRLGSQSYHADVALRGIGGGRQRHASRAGGGEHDRRAARAARCCIRCRPASRSTPTRGINDPHGMVGEKLGVDMHVVSSRPERRAQPDAGGRALPSRRRGGGRHALRGGPRRARRRRGGDGRAS